MRIQKKTNPQVAKWCFTLNNPVRTSDELLAIFRPRVKYLIFQEEKGDSGTPHYQGYVNYKRSQRFGYCKKLLPGAHWEPSKAGDVANTAYCSKPEGRIAGPWKIGTPVYSGKRADLAMLKKRTLAGEPMATMLKDCNNYQQLRFVEKLCSYAPLSHDYSKRQVYWLYGETGTGKTKKAYRECPPGNTYHANTGQWFNSYIGQEYVIIDEIRAKNWSYDLMLKLLDGYERRLPIKGGFTTWNPKTIYITGPLTPEETYGGTLKFHGSIDQLLRRITKVIRCTNEGTGHLYTTEVDNTEPETVADIWPIQPDPILVDIPDEDSDSETATTVDPGSSSDSYEWPPDPRDPLGIKARIIH